MDTITIASCINPGCENTWQENAMDRRQRSRELSRMARECGALPEDNFQLSSGVDSGRYLDGVTLGMHGPAALAIGFALSGEAALVDADVIAGPAPGAAPLVMAAVSQRAAEPGRKPLRGALVRERKNHGIQGMVAGDLRNRDRVMLVEDVVTTGQSLEDAGQIIWEMAGGIIVHEVAMLDRQE